MQETAGIEGDSFMALPCPALPCTSPARLSCPSCPLLMTVQGWAQLCSKGWSLLLPPWGTGMIP